VPPCAPPWRSNGADADVVVIEGMMGCFDGIDGVSEDGSTAQVAKWLAHPWCSWWTRAQPHAASPPSHSASSSSTRPLDLAAVIVNNVGSVTHGRWVLDAIAQRCRAVGLGALARDAQLTLPERPSGAVTAAEGPLTTERMNALADSLERAIDLDRLLTIADRGAPMRTARGGRRGGAGAGVRRRHWTSGGGEARSRQDPAAAHPRASAARLPLRARAHRRRPRSSRSSSITKRISHGCAPPARRSSSGAPRPRPSFPTSTDSTSRRLSRAAREALAANGGVRRAVRKFVEAGGVVYAECGGLMYLAEAARRRRGRDPRDGRRSSRDRPHARPRRLSLGYTTVTTTAPRRSAPPGSRRAATSSTTRPSIPFRHRCRASIVWPTRGVVSARRAYQIGARWVSYAHLHFASKSRAGAGARRRMQATTRMSRGRRSAALLVTLLVTLVAIGEAGQLSVRDMEGRELLLPALPQRIVSLVPSVTEMIYALGGEDRLAGRTDFLRLPAGGARQDERRRHDQSKPRDARDPEARPRDRDELGQPRRDVSTAHASWHPRVPDGRRSHRRGEGRRASPGRAHRPRRAAAPLVIASIAASPPSATRSRRTGARACCTCCGRIR